MNNGCQFIGQGHRLPGGCDSTHMHGMSSYCHTHWLKIYQEGTALKRRKKDTKTAAAVWDVLSEIESVATEIDLEDEF